jgi:hypothetical protein
MQLAGDHFDFACWKVGIGFLACDDFAFDGDNEFASHLFGFSVRRGLRFLVEDDLDNAGAIANVEEEKIAEVAAAMDPAQDDGVVSGVGAAEGAAVVSAFEVAEKVEHRQFPFGFFRG